MTKSRLARSYAEDKILDEAVEWLMRLHEGNLTDQEQQLLEIWQQKSAAHQATWAHAERLMGKFQGLPPNMAFNTLMNTSSSRRIVLKGLAALIATAPVAWIIADDQQWSADYRTARGQQREVTLADASKLILNSRTAVDVSYTPDVRRIYLRQGEIWVETALDNQPQKRPFIVQTREGTVQALGTQFLVRQEDGQSVVAVTEGTVRIQLDRLAEHAAVIIHANQQVSFSEKMIAPVRVLQSNQLLWRQGMLIVDQLALIDFVKQLEPYHRGVIRVSDSVKKIEVSGAYPIYHLDQVYRMLRETYGLDIEVYMGGYWVNMSERS